MLTHPQIWAAIDALAERAGLTPSGLARRAGLDPTAFNRSKRATADGHLRWPSTESIAKVLTATGVSLDDFMALVGPSSARPARMIPLLTLDRAGAPGAFDGEGEPAGPDWDACALPGSDDATLFALEVTNGAYEPLYREGDVLIVAPRAPVRRGDRIMVRLHGGEVRLGILRRRTARLVEWSDFAGIAVAQAAEEVAFVARIIWASQ